MQSDCRPHNESQGILDLTSTLLENVDLANGELVRQKNQKDLLFVYNFFFQNNNKMQTSFENVRRVLLNHQLTNEF